MSRGAALHAAGSPRLAGTLYALLSASAFGTMPVLFTLATRAGFERHSLLAQRFLLASVILLAWLGLRGEARPAWRPLLRCVLLGLVGYSVQAWTYFQAVSLGGAGLATVLLYLYPSFVTLLAWALHGERPSGRRVAALGVALLGCALTSSFGPLRPSLAGVLTAIAAALLYALYLTLSGVVLREVRALTAGAWLCLGAAIAFSALAGLSGQPTLADTPRRAAFVVTLALACTIVPIGALFAAIARIGVARSAALSTVEPAVTLVLAAWLLGERFSGVQIVGALLVVSSVLLIQREGA